MFAEYDRFEYVGTGTLLRNTIWEVRRLIDKTGVCVSAEYEWLIGLERSFDFDQPVWKFIGNYRKDINITTLYAILNSGE